MSPTASGLMTLPLVVGMLVTSTGSGQIVTRTGRYKIFPVIGMLCVAGSLYLLSRLHTDSPELVIGIDLAVLGVGMGLSLQILILAAQNAAAPADLASTTSGVSFFRNLGGAMGVAAFGAILTNRVADEITGGFRSAGIPLPSGGDAPELGSPAEIQKLPPQVRGIIQDAFTNSLETVFLYAIPVALLGFVAVLLLRELPLRGSANRGGTDTPAATPADDGVVRPPAPAARTGAVAAVGAGRHARGAHLDDDRDARLPTPAEAPANGAVPAAQDLATQVRLLAQQNGQGGNGGVPVRGVVRTRDGEPVPSAALTLIGVDGHQLARAITQEDGRYALPTPGPGSYVLIAATGGHEPQAATLVVGDRPVEFDLLLAGSGGLAGTVRGGDGAPVANAMVVVTDVRGDVVGTARTGGDGRYLFENIAAGAYTLAVSAAAHRPVALPVEVTGNGQTRADVEMPPGARIRGTVRNESGAPVGDARVTLVDAAGQRRRDGDHRAGRGVRVHRPHRRPVHRDRVRISSGRNRPVAFGRRAGRPRPESRLPRRMTGADPSGGGNPDENLECGSLMDAERGLRGTVRTKDGWAVRHAIVTVTDLAGNQVARDQVGEDGVLAAGPLPAGTYTVIVTAMGFQPAASTLIVSSAGTADIGKIVLGRAGGTELPAPGTWTIDPAHSNIAAVAQHLGLSSVRGRFAVFEGRVEVAEPVEESRVTARIEAASIDTGNKMRDDHLRSADFLNVDDHPVITYEGDGLTGAGPDRWTVHGRLTLNGLTQPVDLDMTYLGIGADPWGGVRSAFRATAELRRTDFGIRFNQILEAGIALVGESLRVELEIQALQGEELPQV
ncbi:YceI family protein [Actinomadura madurae]|nr:carboxypeptidase regulatory-like domain-containing protein [Actinomadura madurae]